MKNWLLNKFNLFRKKQKPKPIFNPLLDETVFGQVLQFMSPAEAFDIAAIDNYFARAEKTCKKYRKDQLFLKYVARGNEIEVKKMLDIEVAKRLDGENSLPLLTTKSNFIDHANRHFHNITPFQLAVFNLDSPMRDLLASYMSPAEVQRQLAEIEKYGIDYDIPLEDYKRLLLIAPEITPPLKNDPSNSESSPFVTLNEQHYDWAYRIYKSAYESYLASNYQDWNILWGNVGFSQYYFVAPVINLFCSDIAFDPIPDFTRYTPERESLFYNWENRHNYDWFDEFSSEVLHFSLGIYRAAGHVLTGGRRAAAGGRVYVLSGRGRLYDHNLEAAAAFVETRTSDYVDFTQSRRADYSDLRP